MLQRTDLGSNAKSEPSPTQPSRERGVTDVCRERENSHPLFVSTGEEEAEEPHSEQQSEHLEVVFCSIWEGKDHKKRFHFLERSDGR